MKRLSLLVVLLLSLAAVSVLFWGSTMRGQEAEDALLLFVRYETTSQVNRLFVLNANSGEERWITDDAADAGWSPDGRIWVVDPVPEGERRLRFIDAETGEESVFAEDSFFNFCSPTLFWSPDGAQFAYSTGSRSEKTLTILNQADGTSYQVVVEPSTVPQWSPDGDYILLHIPELSSASTLMVAATGSELLDLSESDYALFSPDSRYMVYEENDSSMLYELATGERIALGVLAAYPTWSGSGRYLMMDVYPYLDSLSYYDTQSASLESIDLGFAIGFAAWTADETGLLLYADFTESIPYERPTSLRRYDLASGESETLLETTGWVGAVYELAGGLTIQYSSSAPEDIYAPTTELVFLNETGRMQLNGNSPAWSSNRRYLSAYHVLPQDRLSYIEMQTGTENLIELGYPFRFAAWTEDESAMLLYANFVDFNPQGLLRYDLASGTVEPILELDTWIRRVDTGGGWVVIDSREGFYHYEMQSDSLVNTNPESASESFDASGISHTVIGWRGQWAQNSLLYCGEGV